MRYRILNPSIRMYSLFGGGYTGPTVAVVPYEADLDTTEGAVFYQIQPELDPMGYVVSVVVTEIDRDTARQLLDSKENRSLAQAHREKEEAAAAWFHRHESDPED